MFSWKYLNQYCIGILLWLQSQPPYKGPDFSIMEKLPPHINYKSTNTLGYLHGDSFPHLTSE